MAHVNATFSASNNTFGDHPKSTTMGALILSIVFLLGFPGNLFIIWSILARAKRHSVTTLIILNLAIADGSLMALTPFFIAYLVSKDWPFGEAMCKILFYLCLLNMYASIQLIMLMSVYRMLAVLWPQRMARISGRKTVMRVLAVVWVLVMIASIPAIVIRKVGKKSNSDKMVCDSFHEEDKRSRMPMVMMARLSTRELSTKTELELSPCSTGGHPVHAGAHPGVSHTLHSHRVLLHTDLTTHPTDPVRSHHPQRESHPGHCVDVLHFLVALPHHQHGASMSHVLFHCVYNFCPVFIVFGFFVVAIRSHGLCVRMAKSNKCKYSHH